jgi:predicted ATP-dependent serine protease
VKHIAARGFLTVLSGKGGTGKTTFCLQLAADVGDRHRWGPPELKAYPERSAVLSSEHAGALHTNAEDMGIGSSSVGVYNGQGLDLADADQLAALEHDLITGRVTFLVLDSLRRLAPSSDENSSADASSYIGGLAKLAERTGIAIVLIHHWNKSGSARGSEAIRDAADFTLDMESTEQPNVFRLAPDKWRTGAKPAPWFVKREVQQLADVAGRSVELLQYADVGHPVRRPVTDDLVVALRGLSPRVWSTAELYAELGLDGRTSRDRERLSQARKPLLETGELQQISPGRYRRSDNLTRPD